jgi:ABC-type transporter Mla subunit MlaD
MLSSMEEKLESMMKLIDRISAATGALKAQGTDVSRVESDLSNAQAKVSSALFAVHTLAESLPTALTVHSEETAKEDVLQAITDVKSQVVPVRTAFAEARDAVGLALTDLENLTDAVQVGLWPER